MYLLCPPSPPLCRQASRLLLLPRAEGQGLDNEHNRQTYHLDDHQPYHCNHIIRTTITIIMTNPSKTTTATTTTSITNIIIISLSLQSISPQ